MLAAVLLAGISCSQEIGVEVTPSANQPEKVHMSFTAGLSTKAFITDGATVDVSWNADDKIAVWDGTEWCEFAATSVVGSNAVFEGEITPKGGFEVTDFKAVYPYSAITNTSSEAISVSVPAAQVVPGGKFVDPAALVAVAPCNAEGLLSFTQVCALVKVTLKKENLSAVTLDGTGFAGTVVCNPDGTIASSTARTDNITLTSATGTFPADAGSGTDYYIAVLPSTTVLTVGMTRESDGYTGIRTTASAVTLEQGVAKAWIKDTAISSWEYNISTPEQLLNCAGQWSSSFTSTVNLLADIDMTSISASWPVNDFAGVLNGNNKKIYNYTCSASAAQTAAFFKTVTGTVKDICFGSSDGASADGVSYIKLLYTSSSEAWFYAGLFIRFGNGADISGITNYIPVEVQAGNATKTRVGGLVGVVESGASVTFHDCVNYGSVSNNATTASNTCNLGGIIGRCDVAVTMSNIVNRGAIVCKNPKVLQLGGLVSGVYSGSSFTDCANYGSITYDADLSTTTYIGGIVGHGKVDKTSATSTITNCDNYGSIEIVRSDTAGNLYLGGLFGYTTQETLSNCDNSGDVTSYHCQVNRIGGVVGTAHASSVINKCTNSGTLTLTQTKSITSWQGVGGIAGFSEGDTAPEITGCTNSGEILGSIKTAPSNSRACFGGIIGMPYKTATISGNVNRGNITAENTSGTNPYCQVGGIIGTDSGAATVSTISGNINYGTVTNNTSEALYAFTGGLFGSIAKATSITSCKNYGNVACAAGSAGAVAGSNSTATIDVTLCDAVTVNGVTKAAAADVDAWLCPSNTGTITPAYVAHDAEEK